MLEVTGLQAPEGGLLLATAPRWEGFFFFASCKELGLAKPALLSPA